MSYPSEGWERLAALLTERRVQLGPQYKSRLTFAAETGLNERLISDLENARRASYRPTSLQAVEIAYQWAPGSIQRVLDGGAPITGASVNVSAPAGVVRMRAGDGTVLTENAVVRRIPPWFTTEVERRELPLDMLTSAIEHLRSIAEHSGYSLGGLLVAADLASIDELQGEWPVHSPGSRGSEALADFDRAAQRITSAPHLSKRERERARKELDEGRRKTLEENFGDA